MNARITEISGEVYVADGPIVKVGPTEIDFLKLRVMDSPRGRLRICAHYDGSDRLHEMIIALAQRTYVRPHKHFGKSESFHIIEGCVDVVAFEDNGLIKEIIRLGQPGSGRDFFYRLSAPVYHTLLIRSEILVIHETTNGPFVRGDANFAEWAPEESNPAAAEAYLAALANSVAKFSPAA